jgi:ribosome-associated protein
MYNFDDESEEYSGKSRSQKKRESTAAQRLGTSLTALSDADLEKLALPASLIDAISDWRKFPGHEAKRRQLQYIGRLMQELDTDELQKKLNALLTPSRAEKDLLHEVEKMRDALIASEGRELDNKLENIAARIENAPVSKLRHLAITAQDERRKKRPPKAYRELFRVLKDLLENSQ